MSLEGDFSRHIGDTVGTMQAEYALELDNAQRKYTQTFCDRTEELLHEEIIENYKSKEAVLDSVTEGINDLKNEIQKNSNAGNTAEVERLSEELSNAVSNQIKIRDDLIQYQTDYNITASVTTDAKTNEEIHSYSVEHNADTETVRYVTHDREEFINFVNDMENLGIVGVGVTEKIDGGYVFVTTQGNAEKVSEYCDNHDTHIGTYNPQFELSEEQRARYEDVNTNGLHIVERAETDKEWHDRVLRETNYTVSVFGEGATFNADGSIDKAGVGSIVASKEALDNAIALYGDSINRNEDFAYEEGTGRNEYMGGGVYNMVGDGIFGAMISKFGETEGMDNTIQKSYAKLQEIDRVFGAFAKHNSTADIRFANSEQFHAFLENREASDSFVKELNELHGIDLSKNASPTSISDMTKSILDRANQKNLAQFIGIDGKIDPKYFIVGSKDYIYFQKMTGLTDSEMKFLAMNNNAMNGNSGKIDGNVAQMVIGMVLSSIKDENARQLQKVEQRSRQAVSIIRSTKKGIQAKIAEIRTKILEKKGMSKTDIQKIINEKKSLIHKAKDNVADAKTTIGKWKAKQRVAKLEKKRTRISEFKRKFSEFKAKLRSKFENTKLGKKFKILRADNEVKKTVKKRAVNSAKKKAKNSIFKRLAAKWEKSKLGHLSKALKAVAKKALLALGYFFAYYCLACVIVSLIIAIITTITSFFNGDFDDEETAIKKTVIYQLAELLEKQEDEWVEGLEGNVATYGLRGDLKYGKDYVDLDTYVGTVTGSATGERASGSFVINDDGVRHLYNFSNGTNTTGEALSNLSDLTASLSTWFNDNWSGKSSSSISKSLAEASKSLGKASDDLISKSNSRYGELRINPFDFELADDSDAWKVVTGYDGGSELNIRPYGESTHTSNIKDILCMLDVMFEFETNPDSQLAEAGGLEAPAWKFKWNTYWDNVGNKFKIFGLSVANLFTGGGKAEELSDAIKDYEGHTDYGNLKAYVLSEFEASHQEQLDLEVIFLPLWESEDEYNEDTLYQDASGRAGGVPKACPENGCCEATFYTYLKNIPYGTDNGSYLGIKDKNGNFHSVTARLDDNPCMDYSLWGNDGDDFDAQTMANALGDCTTFTISDPVVSYSDGTTLTVDGETTSRKWSSDKIDDYDATTLSDGDKALISALGMDDYGIEKVISRKFVTSDSTYGTFTSSGSGYWEYVVEKRDVYTGDVKTSDGGWFYSHSGCSDGYVDEEIDTCPECGEKDGFVCYNQPPTYDTYYRSEDTTYTVKITWDCQGHKGHYCGGHIMTITTGYVYSFSDKQLSSVDADEVEFDEKVDTDMWNECTETGNLTKMVAEGGLNLHTIVLNNGNSYWVGVPEGGTAVGDTSLVDIRTGKDIFDTSNAIKWNKYEFPASTWDEFVPWTEENMTLAIQKYKMDWIDVYGFDLPVMVGGADLLSGDRNTITSSNADSFNEIEVGKYDDSAIDKIVGGVITHYNNRGITISEDRERAIRLALSCVGNGYYDSDRCHFHSYSWGLHDGSVCYGSDCSGFGGFILLASGKANGSSLSLETMASVGASPWTASGSAPYSVANEGNALPADIFVHSGSDGGLSGHGGHCLVFIGYVDEDIMFQDNLGVERIIRKGYPITVDCTTLADNGCIYLRNGGTYDDMGWSPSEYIQTNDGKTVVHDFDTFIP